MSWAGAWIDRDTGALRPFLVGEEARMAALGFSAETHDFLDAIPAEYEAGTVEWDAGARAFVPVTPVIPVPPAVTPLQMRKAIRQAGLKPTVDAFIASLAGTEEGDAAIEAWEYAVEIVRADPFIAMAVAGLGWNEGQADDLFRLAATL